MLVFPNAKINLGLYVTGKRPDGYHNIESVFYPVPLTDVLEITRLTAPWSMNITGLKVDGEQEKNLCMKAARLFSERYNVTSSTIYLHKIIPMGAGLGGGSADAAYTLIALNKLNGVPASVEELFEMAMQIGSDSGFFIRNKPCLVKGRGEKVTPVDVDLKGYHLAIVKPDVHVSTIEAYSMIKPSIPEITLEELIKQPVEKWRNSLSNDFEKPVSEKYPVIREIKEKLYASGAIYASMSGSGSAVYGLFSEPVDLEDIFRDHFYWMGVL